MAQTLHFHLHQVAEYINWGYLFHAWGLPFAYESLARVKGCEACRLSWADTLPAEEQGEARQAVQLFQDANRLLSRLDYAVQTHARIDLLPANGDGDDIVVWDERGDVHRLPMLRQQHGEECKCLADYLLPIERGQHDQIGQFVASVDQQIEDLYPDDSYQHMLAQTLADRLAEATGELVHQMVRTRLWGYSPDERLTPQQLFNEEYQGRRPAVGYPSIPDQSINFLLDELLDMSAIGVSLTENGAMRPHASTSGLMLAHPALRHFAVGPISQDQLADYAQRRGLSVPVMQKFLAANLQP